MRSVIDAIEGEYRRYKSLAEDALAQLRDDEVMARHAGGNSPATLMQHMAGNLKSRFTDFLTSDGEKSWRDRESEFADRSLSRTDLFEEWEAGWRTLFDALATLIDEHLNTSVTIRGVQLSVVEALTRSLAHAAYHAGQIVLIARAVRGQEWRYLSIPPGGSAAYNAAPRMEKPPK